MSETVFVDTNVLVYARDAGEPRKQPVAAAWLKELWREQRGRTSMQVLTEYYVTVTRKLQPGLKPDDAWGDVTSLLAWQPHSIDREVLTRARDVERRHRLSWWDAMIVAAAQLQDCDVLLTEDLQPGARFDGVRVRNPFDGAVAEPTAPESKLSVVSRHPPRGRPRRTAI